MDGRKKVHFAIEWQPTIEDGRARRGQLLINENEDSYEGDAEVSHSTSCPPDDLSSASILE